MWGENHGALLGGDPGSGGNRRRHERGLGVVYRGSGEQEREHCEESPWEDKWGLERDAGRQLSRGTESWGTG